MRAGTPTGWGQSDRSIGQIIAPRARTGNNIRRGSVDVADDRCRQYVTRFEEDERAAYLQAAERYDLEHKEEGKYVGPFRGRGMDVLRYLWREARANGGECSPSHAQIAAALKMGVRSVVRIMKALFLAGFLEWQRRSIERADQDGEIHREQTSNLYRFNAPTKAASMIRRLVAARRRENVVVLRGVRVIGSAEVDLRPDQWLRSLYGDGRLSAVLGQLARSLDRATLGAKLAHSEG